jgi:glycine/D-amino acid oxidase-like deaminating enzyme
MQYDYIIVGQGLSGSLLAHELLKRNHKVLVYDELEQPQASGAAAGIFNPFTGRKLVKTWMADTLFPYLIQYYNTLQAELQVKVIHEIPMYRPFLTINEQNEWGTRLYDESYAPYIDSIIISGHSMPQVVNPLGGLMLKQTGYVNIIVLIKTIRDLLIQGNALASQRFDPAKLEILNNQVYYGDHRAKKLIFCEGPWIRDNPFFDWLPMRPVKGELLEIELEQPLKNIVNRGVFILPYNGKNCKVGATFDNQNTDWETTEAAKLNLQQRLESLLQMPYTVKSQLAGVRPATADRRPLIGLHPKFEPLGVFNGLGTKGVSLAPYLIRQFCEFLERGEPLIPQVSISRYFSLYYNKF